MPTELSQNQIRTQDFFIKKLSERKQIDEKHIEFKNKKEQLRKFIKSINKQFFHLASDKK